MPSTVMCPGIRVNSMACTEAEGLVWVANPETALQEPEPTFPELLPLGYAAVARVQVC